MEKIRLQGITSFGSCAGSESVVTTCDSNAEGVQRYNSTLKTMQFCDGSLWQSYGSAGMAIAGSVASRASLPTASDHTDEIFRITGSKKLVYSDGSDWYYFDGSSASSYVSCLDHFNDGATTDGTYSIDPDGSGSDTPYDVYCDMTTNGGGWTLVARVLATSTTHDTANALGSLTDPSQATTAKLSDTNINKIAFTRISQKITTVGTFFVNTSTISLGTSNFTLSSSASLNVNGPFTYEYFTLNNCSSDCGVSLINNDPGFGDRCGYRFYSNTSTKRAGMGCRGNHGKAGTVWVR